MAFNGQNQEILANSKWYLQIDQLEDAVIAKVTGLGTTLSTAGDMKSLGVSKGGKSTMQATVSGVESASITVEFVATVEDKRLHDWYRASHSIGGPMAGGGSESGGEQRTASLIVYNQEGKEAAKWSFVGVFPKTYKTSKMEPGGTELFRETVEFVYSYMHRVL
jgi:phage tail-like protein